MSLSLTWTWSRKLLLVLPKQHKTYMYNVTTSKLSRNNSRLGTLIVLLITSNNKLTSEWQGPCVVTAVWSPSSYRVSFPNGSRKDHHVNELRPYVHRIQACGVFYDTEPEADFGEVYTCPDPVDNFEENLAQVDLSHLSDQQQEKVIKLIRDHKPLFNDFPGSCTVTEHCIDKHKRAVTVKTLSTHR